MGLNDQVSSVRRIEAGPRDDAWGAPQMETPTATLFEQEGFGGRSFTTEEQIANLDRQGFRGRAASVEVEAGRWVVCESRQFGGRCTQLQPGRYPSVASMGLSGRVASVRSLTPEPRIGSGAAVPLPAYDARRRDNERLYQANVTSVREVQGTAGQRCWVDREPVAAPTSQANVPGAIVGALIGGILGHQVGGGTGKDLATAGGAVAGAVVGANVGQGGGQALSTRDVQRCSSANVQAQPSYWEVSYTFRGVEHHVQMNVPPQATVTVNEQGEPRV